MKRCSTSLIIRENANQNHNEATLTPVRMAIIKKRTGNKCRQGCGEKRTLNALLVGM